MRLVPTRCRRSPSAVRASGLDKMLPDGKRPSSGHSEGSGVTADDVHVR